MRVLGLDIGGTSVRAALGESAAVRVVRKIGTPRSLASLRRALRSLIAEYEPDRVGIGIAGVVSGTSVLRCANIPYLKTFDFRDAYPGFPVRVDNDARCFARAESDARRGTNGARYRSIMAVTLGTGVGRAVVRNGRILRVTRFEEDEEWEPEYQRVRDGGDDLLIGGFLAEPLAALARRYRVQTLVVGGGLATHPEVMRVLRSYLVRMRVVRRVEAARRGENAGAVGAVLLFGNTGRQA